MDIEITYKPKGLKRLFFLCKAKTELHEVKVKSRNTQTITTRTSCFVATVKIKSLSNKPTLVIPGWGYAVNIYKDGIVLELNGHNNLS